MSNAVKPTILVIPGSFSPAFFYHEFIDALKSHGYEVEVYDLPSARGKPPQEPATMYDDAAFFRQKALELINSGKNVVLLSHSYGGIVGSETLKDLPTDAGNGAAVVGAVYLTALTPKVGQSLADGMTEGLPPFINLEDDGYMWHEIKGSAETNFSDMAEEEAIGWAKKFSQHSYPSFKGKLTHPGYWDVPVAYIRCSTDKTLPPEFQDAMIENIRDGGRVKVHVHHLDAGHFPPLSQPIPLGKLIAEAVEGLGA